MLLAQQQQQRHVRPGAPQRTHAAVACRRPCVATTAALRHGPRPCAAQQQQPQQPLGARSSSCRRPALTLPCRAAGGGEQQPAGDEQQQQQQQQQVVYNTEFGYSRKDVLIIIVGLIGLGILMYEGLQATGMEPGIAGNYVQATIFLGICVGWVSTYLWRVATKKMTYAKQLEMYEAAVMQKRLEEMTEPELQRLMTEVEAEKAELQAEKERLTGQQ